MTILPIEGREDPQSAALRPLPAEVTTHPFYDPAINPHPSAILNTERLVAKQVTAGVNNYHLWKLLERTEGIDFADNSFKRRIIEPRSMGVNKVLFVGPLEKAVPHLRGFEGAKIRDHWKVAKDDLVNRGLYYGLHAAAPAARPATATTPEALTA